MDRETEDDPAAVIATMIEGLRAAQAMVAACELGVPEAIAAGHVTVDALAEETGGLPDRLRRSLPVWEAAGVVARGGGERLRLTAVGELLRPDVPGSLRRQVELLAGFGVTGPWSKMAHCIRTGDTAWRALGFPGAFGPGGYWSEPERAGLFAAAMGAITRSVAAKVSTYLVTRGVVPSNATIVDVGGADGTLLAAVLAAHPHARGVVLDTEVGLVGAEGVLRAAGVGDRASLVVGDFNIVDAIPAAGVYLLKSVLHDWPDEVAAHILATVAASAPPEAVLVVVDQVLSSGAPPAAWISDLTMMVAAGGRERSAGEFETLLAGAGWRGGDPTPLGATGFSVITARRSG